MGRFLVKADEPARADVAVVLAGDLTGDRIRTAVRLAREGYVPLIVVSGPCCMYGLNEGEMAVQLAVKEGSPPDLFVVVPNRARSTREEAFQMARFLRSRKISSLLVVTSTFHTRRAGSIYRATIPDLSPRIVASPYRDFQPDAWWRSRQGQKVFLGEWEKTVANWFGI
jgi:uncharacterized SAM-binding protein YcdF (DUF218 family)